MLSGAVCQGFGYFDHGTCFQKLGLLRADGVHLSEEGKSIFCHRLAKVRRALNERCQGEGNLSPSHSSQFGASVSNRLPEPEEGSQVRRKAPEHHKGIPATPASNQLH